VSGGRIFRIFHVLQDFIYCVLGFVPADVVRLKKDVWFSKIDSEQMALVEEFLASKKHVWD
jgi:hypothetical protein